MLWKSPYVLLVIATCLWGGNFVVGKIVVSELPPFTLAFLRWGTAFLAVLPFFGRELWRHRRLLFKHWSHVLFLAVTGVASFNTLVYVSVQYTSAINASLVNATSPVVMVLLSPLLLRERFSFMRGIGVCVTLIGVLWIISRGSLSILFDLSFNRGDLWMVLAVLLWALYSIGIKKSAGRFPANALFMATMIPAIVLLAPFSAVEMWLRGETVHVTGMMVGSVLYVGLFASLVAFSCWNKAVSLLGPSRCAGFLSLIPLFSAVFATLFADEAIQSFHLVGAVGIITGLYVTTIEWPRSRKQGKSSWQNQHRYGWDRNSTNEKCIGTYQGRDI